ncbi:hypothetical protein BXZ70DRAFT_1010210 [Cristinia sonorae]|uniref:Uncharacterized protein n=1 Tax=Cristinia sonorae TaxID=1940300 RepID=A0A8K0UIY5_9AGAR|nr:hypothetical protein BXZ70DRAFT_1010210 [Cristinia sonorae]
MFTLRSIGCAIHVLTVVSYAQAAYTPLAPNSGSSSGAITARGDDSPISEPLALLFGTASNSLNSGGDTSSKRSSDTLGQRDVYSPRISDPRTATTWIAGSTAVVKWDTSDPPRSITNRSGKLVLGYIDARTDNEHLFLDNPLAANFDIMRGSIKVRVPQVPPGNNYIVVLFGDSGNRSPEFTIN